MFSILRHLPGADGLGFEFEQTIFEMTTRDIASLAAPIRLVRGDYRTLLGQHRFPANRRIVAFLAPPWGDALKADTGLDLGRTKPPVGEIVDDFEHAYPDSPILYVVEVTRAVVENAARANTHERHLPPAFIEARAVRRFRPIDQMALGRAAMQGLSAAARL